MYTLVFGSYNSMVKRRKNKKRSPKTSLIFIEKRTLSDPFFQITHSYPAMHVRTRNALTFHWHRYHNTLTTVN